eukprot:gnl/Chilomastix_cuspidata/2289.p1 GENE.gnl/Chilomastix_cuspidata/2289~~gnl/Chilomastix_cuspidata/2289.p1  ORF type:complete len:526 (-),score=207.89 gnl/Chilomastix_cuspidata/2289:481-2058(-)
MLGDLGLLSEIDTLLECASNAETNISLLFPDEEDEDLLRTKSPTKRHLSQIPEQPHAPTSLFASLPILFASTEEENPPISAKVREIEMNSSPSAGLPLRARTRGAEELTPPDARRWHDAPPDAEAEAAAEIRREVASLRRHLSEAKRAVQELAPEILDLRQQRDAHKKRADKLASRLSRAEARLAQLRLDAQRTRVEDAQITRTIGDAMVDVQRLKRERARYKRERNRAVTNARARLAQLQRRVVEAEKVAQMAVDAEVRADAELQRERASAAALAEKLRARSRSREEKRSHPQPPTLTVTLRPRGRTAATQACTPAHAVHTVQCSPVVLAKAAQASAPTRERAVGNRLELVLAPAAAQATQTASAPAPLPGSPRALAAQLRDASERERRLRAELARAEAEKHDLGRKLGLCERERLQERRAAAAQTHAADERERDLKGEQSSLRLKAAALERDLELRTSRVAELEGAVSELDSFLSEARRQRESTEAALRDELVKTQRLEAELLRLRSASPPRGHAAREAAAPP